MKRQMSQTPADWEPAPAFITIPGKKIITIYYI